MNLDERDISLIIERVRREIDEKTGGKAACPRNAGTVVLIPGFVPSPDKAVASIAGQYGNDFELVFLSPILFPAKVARARSIDWKTQPNELVELLVNAETVVLLAPGTGLLRRIGTGQEEEGVGELLLRRLLWGKTFVVLMDFTPPKFRRGTYYAQIVESIDALCSMGVRFETYHPLDRPAQDAYTLVTEQDIVEAKRNGRKTVLCVKDAIITPLAVDSAKELRINIEYA
jgi:hypothetical protein